MSSATPRKIRVQLGPTQTENWGMAIIVIAPTGIVYENQTGGHSCWPQSAEGFLVPVGHLEQEHRLSNWMELHFGGWCDASPENWTPDNIDTLKEFLTAIPVWYYDSAGIIQTADLQLDETRLDECMEAWVPVETPFGKGVLTFTNSD